MEAWPSGGQHPQTPGAAVLPVQDRPPLLGPLHLIKARDSPSCLGCSGGTETVRHLISCRQWRHQRENFYAGLAEAGVRAPQDSEQSPEARLFQDPKATKALLAFIGAIRERDDIKQAWEQAFRTDNWGIETLDEGEREGGVGGPLL
jgi:hypothetical protein